MRIIHIVNVDQAGMSVRTHIHALQQLQNEAGDDAQVWPVPFKRWPYLQTTRLMWRLRAAKADVIHGHCTQVVRALARWRRLLPPVVTTLHGDIDLSTVWMQGVICHSSWQQRKMAGYLGARKTAVRQLPYWWPASQLIRFDGEAMRLRSDWQCKPDTHVFMVFGPLTRQSGFDGVIRAFAAAFGSDTDVRLVVVGEGAFKEQLRGLASKDPRIIFAGQTVRGESLFQATDVYLHTRPHNGGHIEYPVPLLLAMQAGCRLMVKPGRMVEDILQDVEHVQWINPADTDVLMECLRLAQRTPRKRYVYDLQAYDGRVTVTETRSLYQRVMETSTVAAGKTQRLHGFRVQES